MLMAFGSCCCVTEHPDQVVWERIAAAKPDHLILLGDLIYLDIDAPKAPSRMEDLEFADHLLSCYRRQLGQPQFAALLAQMKQGSVHHIWDDHDFLWNDACGADLARIPKHAGKIPLSRAAFANVRRALSSGQGLAALPPDSAPWFGPGPVDAPGQSLKLDTGLWLHLLDVRSQRRQFSFKNASRLQMMDPAQCAEVTRLVQAHPDDIHLLASGSSSKDWQRCAADWRWLLQTAAQARCLLLSGDIHHNACKIFETTGLPLHELTSSGLAIKRAVEFGKSCSHHGQLEINADRLSWKLLSQGASELEYEREIQRATWRR